MNRLLAHADYLGRQGRGSLASELRETVNERDIYKRAFEFLEALSDGGGITVNGRPWRDVYEGLQAIVPDPLPLPPAPLPRLEVGATKHFDDRPGGERCTQ